jgi:hypothetical protein
MRFIRCSVVFAVALALAGCALGINKDSPSVSYTVPRDYRTVFLRVQNQANECLRGKNEYTVQARVDPATQSGEIEVVGPLGGTVVARTELRATDAQHTHLTQTVWGRHPWDAQALDAMRQSVRMDMSVCFAYR